MQLNRRGIVFYWNGWIVSLLVCLLIGIGIGWTVEESRIKASDLADETGLVLSETWYRITYHSSGGEGEMEVSELSDAGEKLSLNEFYKTGYSFAGWAVSEGGPVMYADGAMFYPTKDMTLYAVWEVKKYAVSLEGAGENASGNSSSVSYGSTVSVYAGTKEGYTFAGWSVESGELVLEDASSVRLSFSMPDGEVCLSAHWTLNSYQVVVSDIGEGGSGSVEAVYQSVVTIQSGVKKGYTFAGWIVEAGDVVLADASASTTTFVVGTSDIKIKALWNVNTYHLTVIGGGEDSTGTQDVDFGERVTVNAGTKEGFYFYKWEVAAGSIDSEILFNREMVFSMPDSDLELRAVWKEITEVKAELNQVFYDAYDREGCYKDGCYNIGQKIVIGKEMLDVKIIFSDGSMASAKIQDYELKNQEIKQLGENRIEILLTAGNSGFFCFVQVMGYSSELDAVIKDLGLSEGDYSGLAVRVEQIQAEILRLGGEIVKYEENLAEIKRLLREAEEDVDLTGELGERLENVQGAIAETIKRLVQVEDELNKIERAVISIIEELGLDREELEGYQGLLNLLKRIQEELKKIKTNEAVMVEEVNQIAEKLGITDRLSSFTDAEQEQFFQVIGTKIDEIKKQLELCQAAVDQLKEKFEIANTGSFENQLKEVVEKIESHMTYLEDLKDEIERQLEGEYGEIQVEGLSQIDAIFVRIRTLKDHANGLKQFYISLQKLFGFDSSSTKEEIYQSIVAIKEKVTEYNQFLDQAEQLLNLEEGNTNSSFNTPEQTKKELNKVYTKMEYIINDLEFLKEMFQVLLEKEEISTENKEEILILIEDIKRQKEETNMFIDRLKELLELETQVSEQEIYNKISDMKDTLAEYWLYLGEVETLIRIENGSSTGSAIVTGPVVTGRLTAIYQQLTDMVDQQVVMSETIQKMLEKDKISSEIIQKLQEIQQEMLQQKQQADLFLEELRKLLELEDSAGYKEVIHTVTNMKQQLKHYIIVIEELMQQLKMVPSDGEQGNVSEQLKDVFNKVLELIQQLEEQIKKSETAEQTVLFLEQKIEMLLIKTEEEKYTLKEKNSKLEEENDVLKEKNNELETENDTLKEKSNKLEEKNGKLETENIRLKEENSKQQKENSRLEEENNKVRKENEELEEENRKLKEEIEKLKQNRSSSDSSDCADRDALERKNRLLQESITELEKQLQLQAKELETLSNERKQLLAEQSGRDRQIGEQREQLELLEKQLIEKEEQKKELETSLQAQKPIQDLLEKNQIQYEELVTILRNQDSEQNQKKISDKKTSAKTELETEKMKANHVEEIETEKIKIEEESLLEESIISKEKREHLKTAATESEELFSEETIQESKFDLEESLETESEQESHAEEQQESDTEKSDRNWAILIIIIILLVLIGSAVLVLCGKDTIQK